MSLPENERAVRRILVALDASRHSLAALEAAAELAARWQAELLGLFVEDVNLLRLAGLPFLREVYSSSATAEPLDVVRMERALRVRAEQARRALAASAARAQVQASFRVVRGQVATEVLGAAAEADLLIMGRESWAVSRRARLGSTALTVATRAACALLVRPGIPVRRPILVVDDGSRSASHALRVAARVAEALGGTLTVLVAADMPAAAGAATDRVAEVIGRRAVAVRVRPLPRVDVAHLARAVRAEGGGVLVLGSRGLLRDEAVERLLHEIESPVLLVRENAEASAE